MGMRRNIALQFETASEEDDKNETKTIYLYTHWGAEGLEDQLAEVLNRDIARARWNDHAYLARIITSNLLKGTENSETGYGLSPYEIDPEFPTLRVDLQNKTVNDVPYEDFIKNPAQFSLEYAVTV